MATESRGSFTGSARYLDAEEEIRLTSVGVDIGSSTSHLVFSRLELRQENSRYVVVSRSVLSESEILLTPYRNNSTIDATALGEFISRQYRSAGLERDGVDTGALILTGLAARRRNARAIGELFAQEAGRFVAVSAGDALESTMAANGSGAAAESGRSGRVILNVDVGGGTSKVAVCVRGKVGGVTALDIGARLVVLDDQGLVARVEGAGELHAERAGVKLEVGRKAGPGQLERIASEMADRLLEVLSLAPVSPETRRLLRLPPLAYAGKIDGMVFSGGVAEFIYGHETRSFNDLGEMLAAAIRSRVERLGIEVLEPRARIRATVIGASQYTVQVSGNTIFIHPEDSVPVRNVPVVAPDFPLEAEAIDARAVSEAVQGALKRLDLIDGKQGVAVGFHWEGSATFARLQSFCSGLTDGLREVLARGHPLMLVNDGDIGGVVGLHLKEEQGLKNPVISVDGIALQEFDYIDIGSLMPSTGAVPVVIKSLVFPGS